MPARILVLIATGAAIAAASAFAKGPALGVSSGPQGVVAPSGAVKYVAMGAKAGGTVVRVVRLSDRKALRSRVIPGRYGIAYVAFNARDGVSGDGKTLVLPSLDRGATTDFAIVSTDTLRVRKVIQLDGLFTFDAISPDGRIVYLIEYLSETSYRVRALNVASGGLYAQVVADKRELGEPMAGYPEARATGNRGWVYTLYGRVAKPAFVHALGTTNRVAICVDLPWGVPHGMRMSLSPDGSQLVLRDRVGRVAVVDTNNYSVKAIRKPR